MAYEKTFWKDRIRDSQGNIIQEGTPVSAGHLNNMEDGITAAHEQLAEQAKETVSLPYGLSVLDSPDGSSLDVEIQGQTLISLGNSPLEGGKKYVLSDPQYTAIVEGTTYQGVAKFEGKNTKPTIIRTANFKNKVSGDLNRNPHIFKWLSLGMSELAPPNHPNFQGLTEGDAWNGYGNVAELDEKLVNAGGRTGNNEIAQHLFQFNLLAEVERKMGVIPKDTLSDKIQWLKDNVEEVSFNWWGYGSSPKGYRADIVPWNDVLSSWTTPWSGHLASETAKMPVILYGINLVSGINSEGIIYFLAYSEASDGITSSIINTNYVDFDIKLKASAIFRTSHIPLYEVSQAEYDKILVEWDATNVANRYPMVESVKSIQNPIITVEGENLIPPFTEWYVNDKAKIINPYKLELNQTEDWQSSLIYLDALPNQQYTLSNGEYIYIDAIDKNGKAFFTLAWDSPVVSFTTPLGTVKLQVAMGGRVGKIGVSVSENPMLTLGSTKKEFSPYNPSHLYIETTLKGLGNENDALYQDDGKWKVLRKWKEDILDGSRSWAFESNEQGYKTVRSTTVNEKADTELILDYRGKRIKHAYPAFDKEQSYMSGGLLYLTLADSETGFLGSYTPTGLEIAAYFNGWKVKSVDGSNKPTAWSSIIDGTDAPTQSLEYVKANKAPNYEGYRLFYQLERPLIEDVTEKVEGALTLNGQTYIKVESGIIFREKVTPVHGDYNAYYINNTYASGGASVFSNQVQKILFIYKNGGKESGWLKDGVNAYGYEQAYISEGLYDPDAIYTVTYIVAKDAGYSANPVNILASYNTSIRSTVNQINEGIADVKALASVHDRYLYKLLLAAKANGWSV